MKRLVKSIKKVSFIKKANHDIEQRTEAVLYINGEIYLGNSHNECINTYQKDNKEEQRGGGAARPEGDELNDLMETYGFAHLVTYEDFCDQVPYDKSEFETDVWNELSSNWKENEVRVYIETDNLWGISLDDMISACKEQIPRDFGYYNLTFWNDTMTSEQLFETEDGEVISVPMYSAA